MDGIPIGTETVDGISVGTEIMDGISIGTVDLYTEILTQNPRPVPASDEIHLKSDGRDEGRRGIGHYSPGFPGLSSI